MYIHIVMSKTKLQLSLATIIVVGLIATVAIQHQTESKMRAENQALRQQVAGLAADNEKLSNLHRQVSVPSALAGDQFRELLRLRGEVGRLRQQTNFVGAVREENRHLHAGLETVKNQLAEADAPALRRENIINAANQIGTAFKIYANDNNHQLPSNFGQISNELGGLTNFGGGVTLDSFQMVNAGNVNGLMSNSIATRELISRQSTDGGWDRVKHHLLQ